MIKKCYPTFEGSRCSVLVHEEFSSDESWSSRGSPPYDLLASFSPSFSPFGFNVFLFKLSMSFSPKVSPKVSLPISSSEFLFTSLFHSVSTVSISSVSSRFRSWFTLFTYGPSDLIFRDVLFFKIELLFCNCYLIENFDVLISCYWCQNFTLFRFWRSSVLSKLWTIREKLHLLSNLQVYKCTQPKLLTFVFSQKTVLRNLTC